MDQRYLEQEELLGDIISDGRDVLSLLNDTDGLDGEDEGSGDDRTMEEEEGDRMPEEEGDRMPEVYILIKPVLTSELMH
jgi:hypothetical protein